MARSGIYHRNRTDTQRSFVIIKIPSTKLQLTNNIQIPSTNDPNEFLAPEIYFSLDSERTLKARDRRIELTHPNYRDCFGFEFWNLGFIWNLEFENWDLCDVILVKQE
jgi:hypothetical protein